MRISVSDLDSFLYWKQSEDMPLEDLLKRLRREAAPTEKMEAGKALHKVLEHATDDLDVVEQDGFKFVFQVEEAITLPVIRELKGEVTIHTPQGPVTLVGVVDGIDSAITDWKLTERFDAERYANSWQWRSYLMMFNARKFLYGVFEYHIEKNYYIIHAYHSLPFYAYEGMEQDVRREVGELAEFVAKHLPERLTVSAHIPQKRAA